MDTSLTFMKMVNCSTVEGWSKDEHGLPVAAVFGTNGRYPRAVHVVSCANMINKVDTYRDTLKSMGIDDVQIKKAFDASLDVVLGVIASVDPKTWGYRETKFPKIDALEVLPEGRKLRDLLFMEPVPEPVAA